MAAPNVVALQPIGVDDGSFQPLPPDQAAAPAAPQPIGTDDGSFVADQPPSPGFFGAIASGVKTGVEQLGQTGVTLARAGTGTLEKSAPLKPVANVIDEKYADTPFLAKLIHPEWWGNFLGETAVGSAPFLAGAAAGAVAGTAVMPVAGTAIGGMVGAMLGGGTTAGLQTFASNYQSARADGADHEKALDYAIKSGLASAGINAASIPAGFIGIMRGPLSYGLRQMGIQTAIGGVDQAAQNLVAQQTYKPEQSLLEGVPESMLGELLFEAPGQAIETRLFTKSHLEDAKKRAAAAFPKLAAVPPVPKPPAPPTAPTAPPAATPPAGGREGAVATAAAPAPAAATGDGTRKAPIVAATGDDVLAAGAVASTTATDGQIAAGNYQKGHLQIDTEAGKLHGTIETTAGETRRSKPEDPVPWQVVMPAPYGYAKATEGMDGEQVDAYFGPQPAAPTAFVIDQVHSDTGQPDEHKAMVGFPTQEAAVAAYTQAFSDGRGVDRIGAVTPMPTAELRTWLAKGDTKAPIAPHVADGVQPTNLPAAVAATGITAAEIKPLADQGQSPEQIAAQLNDRMSPIDQTYLEAGRPELAAAAKVAAIRSLMVPVGSNAANPTAAVPAATSAVPAPGGEAAAAVTPAAAGVETPPEPRTEALAAPGLPTATAASEAPQPQPAAAAAPKKATLPAERRAARGQKLPAPTETAPAAVAPAAAGGEAAPAVGAVEKGSANPAAAISREPTPPLVAGERPVVSTPRKRTPEEKRAAKAGRAAPAERTDIVFSATPAGRKAPETPEFKAWFGGSKVVNPDGAPRVLYHGTQRADDFDRFKLRPGDLGIHVGTEGQANDRIEYMADRGRPSEGMRLIPVYLSIKNPLRLDDLGAWNTENVRSALDAHFGAEVPYLKNTAEIRHFLRAKGYDGIVYKNTGEVTGGREYDLRQSRAWEAVQQRFGGNKYSFSKEDQAVPEYKAYQDAHLAYTRFRESNAEDSYIAFDPRQIKSAIGNRGTFDPKDARINYSATRKPPGERLLPAERRALRAEAPTPNAPVAKRAAAAKPVRQKPAPYTPADGARNVLAAEAGKPDATGRFFRPHAKIVAERVRKFLSRRKGTGDPKNRRMEFRDVAGVVVIGKVTPDDWVHRVETTMTPAEITAYRNWYPDTERIFRQLYGADWEMQRMAWLLGNVQASPRDAAMNALRAQEQEVTGNKVLEAGVNDAFVRQLLRGEAPAGGAGQKIFDFIDAAIGAQTRAIMGDDPRFGAPAPMDRHAMRDVGYIDGTFHEYLRQRFGTKALKAAVDSKDGSWGMPAYETGAEQYRKIAKHLNDIDFDGGGWTPSQVQAVGWRAISRLVSPSESAGAGSMQAILGNLHQLSFEAVPSPDAPMAKLFEKYGGLPFAQQRVVTDKLLSDAMTMAREMTGVREVIRVYGTGGWTNPETGVQSIAAGAQWKVLSSLEAPRGLAAILGYLAQQDAVFTSQPDPKGKTLALNILQDDGGSHLGDDLTVMAYWKALADAEPLAGAGYHPINENGKPGIRLVLGEDTVHLRDKVEGLWQIARLIANDMGFDVAHLALNVRSEMVSNDWKGSPAGQGYLAAVRDAFGPRVQGRLVDHYRGEYETSVRAALAAGKRSFSATAKRLPGQRELPGGAERLATPGGERAAEAALPGLPREVKIPRAGISITAGPFVPARNAARDYAASARLPYKQATHYLRIDPERSTRIAAAFDEMANSPADPLTKAAYAAMAKETMAQWREIQQTGLHVEFFPGDDPYEASPRLATEDVRNNNHLWVFSTDRGYGTTPITAADIAANPLLAQSGDTISGQPARINDIFRVVHDYFGHIKEGVGFRADGEENAWASHALMYSPLARLAMTSETRGQNSWVNYGPHGEANRSAATAVTVFADQKLGVLPAWAQSEGADFLDPVDVDGMRREAEAFDGWFGGSKVVDANGNPLRVFHSRIYDFEAFDQSKQGTFTGHASTPLGFFFTPSPEVANDFAELAQYMKRTGANIVPAFLAIKNPYVMSGGRYHDQFYKAGRVEGRANAEALRQQLDREGYDGIRVTPYERPDTASTPLEFDHDIWIAFSPTQIKSTFNRGTFDPDDPRIGFSVTPRQLADGDRVTVAASGRTIIKNPGLTDLHDLVKEAGYAPNSLGAVLTSRGELLVTNGLHMDIADEFGRSLGEHFTLIMVKDGTKFGILPTVAVDLTGDFREMAPDEVRQVLDAPALQGISTGLVANSWSATPAAQQIRAEMRAKINEIVGRVTGDRAKVEFHDVIRPGPENAEAVLSSGGTPGQTVAGYADWEARIIGLAMNDPQFDPVNEAGHEAWHMIEFMGLVRPDEMAALRRDEAQLREMAAAEFNLPIDDPTIQGLAPHEVRAIAFARYRRIRDMGKMPGLRPAILRAFERVRRVLQQVADWIRGKGFTDFNTVFERAARGTIGGRPDTGQDALGPHSYSSVGYGPIWYSQLERGLSDLSVNNATNVGWKEAIASLKKKGLKDEELEWAGLAEWLDEQGARRVSKDEVLAYVKANTPQLEETVLGQDRAPFTVEAAKEFLREDSGLDPEENYGFIDPNDYIAAAREVYDSNYGEPDDTSYSGSDTTLPGGTEYRELLFHMPAPNTASLAALRREFDAKYGPDWYPHLLSEGDEGRWYDAKRLPEANYTSTHFDDLGRNLLMHVRFDVRTDAKGRRIVYVQEFQSDWHQAGRKEGYGVSRRIIAEREAMIAERERMRSEGKYLIGHPDQVASNARADEINRALNSTHAIPRTGGVANAPFKKTWHEFLFKRMLRWTAQNGFDGLAWSAGSTQNDRYKLSKRVERIEYWKDTPSTYQIVAHPVAGPAVERAGLTADGLADLVGRDAAEKIINTARGLISAEEERRTGLPVQNLRGLDLDIGGAGMTGFYDKMLPTFAAKYVKKWGGAPERTTVAVEPSGFMQRKYVGPTLSDLELSDIRRTQAAGWPAAMSTQLKAVRLLMDTGFSFEDAMVREGSMLLAEKMGGQIVEEPSPAISEPAHVVPITASMRESITRSGQPLYSATPNIPASMPLTRDVYANVIANPNRNALSQQLKAATSTVPWHHKIQTALSFLKARWADTAMQGALDQYYILKKKEIGVRGRIDYTRSPWVKALMTNDLMSTMAPVMGVRVKGQWAGGALKYNAREGVAQIDDSVKPFMAIFDPIAKAGMLDAWQMWAAAKRTQAMIAEDAAYNATRPTNEHRDRDQLFKAEARAKGMTRDDLLAQLVRETERPEFVTAMAEWHRLNKAMLDFAQSAGIINAESRKTWERDYYVPFYRAIDVLGNQQITKPGKKRGLANQSAGIRQLRGGAAPMNSIIENMAQNLAKLTDASFKNMAAQAAIPILSQTGDLVRVPIGWKPVHVDPEQLAYLLESIGVQVQGLTQAQKDEYLQIFTMAPPKGLDILSVMVDGKNQYYRVLDPLAWKALTNLGVQSFSAVTKYLGWFKRALTHAVTLDPAFAIANGIRDSLSTWVVTGEKGFVPFASAAGGFRKALTKDGSLLSYMAAGGGGGGFYQTAPEDIHRKLGALDHRSILTSPAKAGEYMSRLYHGYERVLASTEMANRLALYDKVIKRGGSRAEATLAAKNVLNFSMRGDWAVLRFLTETVPFLNARMQGLYVLGRAIKERPMSFALKGAAITAATLALWALNHDDQRWRDLEEWDKDTYYHIWLDNFFGKAAVAAMGLPSWMNHVRLPKPFEVGAIFSTIPERAAALFEREDTGKVTQKQALAMITQTFSINPIPQALMPVIEQWANKSFFTGRPIVGIGLENLPPELQYNPTTSETARILGGAVGLAPVRLQHMVQGYFGNLGSYVLDAADMAVRYAGDYPSEPRLRVEDIPVVQRFFRDEPAVASKWLTEFYDQHTAIDQVWSGIREARRRGEVDVAMRLQADNAELLRLRPQFNAVYKTITNINKVIRQVYASRTLSSVAMRERVDTLMARRNEIVRRLEPRLRPGESIGHAAALQEALATKDITGATKVADAMATGGAPPTRQEVVRAVAGANQPALADILTSLPSSGLPATVAP